MKIKNVIKIVAVAFILSCANQTVPGGGPVDKTPPSVASVFPANGSVNVDPRARITVTFDEWINRGGVARAVALYPRHTGGLTVKATRDRLVITPNSPLDENTTYILTINTTLRDLRNNAITSPINIVFATGDALDSGTVSGKIMPLENTSAALSVGLYADSDEWKNADYFSAPTYMTQTDSAGTFEFAHLRDGSYRIVAFSDRYRIGRVHVGDTVFTSLSQIITITNNAQFVNLFPALSDTVVVADTAEVVVDDDVVVDNDDAVSDTTLVVDDDVAVDDVALADAATVADTVSISTLSGFAPCLADDVAQNRKWMFRPSGRNAAPPQVVGDSAGTFTFELRGPVSGSLLWFIDDNGDSEITFGNLVPWRSPERFFRIDGNIEIKRGWDVDGLEVDACE